MLKTAIPILASLNADETIKFYTDILGFTLYSNWEGYLMFGMDQIEIHLSSTDDVSIPKNTGCYVNVTAVDELYAKYKAHGIIHPDGALKNMPWQMRQFSIIDNNGNIIHFGEDISGD